MPPLARIFLIVMMYFSAFSLGHAAKLHWQFYGLDKETSGNVQARLNLLKKSLGELTPGKIQSIYQKAPEEIRIALQPYGYFHAKIQSQLLKKEENFTASFTVQPGKPINITQLDINISGPGKNNPQLKQFIQHFPLKIGQVFTTKNYEKAKEDFYQAANQRGYVKSFFSTNKIIIDVEKNRLAIIIHLETGEQFYFGNVHFSHQADHYSDDFLQRFVAPLKDQPFSSEKLLQLQGDMSGSYYFQQLFVTPDFDQANESRQIPVHMDVTAPKSKKYNVGLGYGTLTGPRLTAGASFRQLTNTGQHVDMQLKLSPVLSGLAAKYYIPGKNPINDQWLIGLNYQRFLPKNGSSTSSMLEAGYLTKTEHTQTHAALTFLLENYKVKNLAPEKTQLLYPNFNFNYSQSNDVILPTFGKSLNLTLRGASKSFLSSDSFLQAEIKAKYFFSPFDFSHVIFRTDLGYTLTKNLHALPLTMRFFAGGLNSIRGYADSSIGPGRYLYSGSVEYQNQIKNNWWGAIFYDAGTATDHFGTPLFKGAGVGVLYQSSIGPIKLYLAKTLQQPKKHYSVELSIGPEF